MANPEHLTIIKKGVEKWNSWRKEAHKIKPNLNGTNLSTADLARADLARANLKEANLKEANLKEANLEEADLTGADLTGTDLTEANLTGAKLTRVDLTWADLKEANLRGADLTRADLTGANLKKADLTGAHLKEADLTGAHLLRANLANAHLRETHGLTQLQIGSAIITATTALPVGLPSESEDSPTRSTQASDPKSFSKDELLKFLPLEFKRLEAASELKVRITATEKKLASSIDDFHKEKAERDATFRNLQQGASDLIQQLERVKTESENLKESYAAQLQLEAPAKLWEEQADLYGKQAKNWSIGAVATALVFISLLLIALIFFQETFFPKDLPDQSTTQVTLKTVRSVLMVGTFVSVGAYLIGILVRLAMSAYHLQRDASERQQLTLFYLALLKEAGGANEKDREIILQSLFSRAETGLLKKDAGPTMPISQIAGAVKQSKPGSAGS